MKIQYQFFLLFIISFILSCKKGEYLESGQKFGSVSFTPITGPGVSNVEYNNTELKVKGNQYLIPIDEGVDSVDLILTFSERKDKVKQRVKIGPGNTVFYSYSKSPVDSTIIISDKEPLDGQIAPEGKILVKIFNSNKLLSPDGSPIHLAFYDGVGAWDTFNPEYTDEPVDTLFNITSEFPDKFSVLKRLNYFPSNGGMEGLWKAKILKSDKTPLKTEDGKIIYAYLSFPQSLNTFITYASGDESSVLLDSWDQNSFLPFTDEAVSAGTGLFQTYLSK
ncbi:hypothetical protein [Sphingobacterium hotanense]|uniref:hypothetical protein n=1 Tax=Sphingobacterium hotanense TaxID=649196 RepID=UPI0021A5E0F0|nr:hypothetical protein [Sphingobacterium hotanense]MCT1526121.1 hypothetical protein [Sphingobacterium hotanense]